MGLKYGANFLTIEAQTNAIVGELEDICGQLGDIEGEWQKTAEEAIQRIQKMIEGCMGEYSRETKPVMKRLQDIEERLKIDEKDHIDNMKRLKILESRKDPKIDVVMGEEVL